MPHFSITSAKLQNEIAAGEQGEFTFLVTNQTGAAVKAQARVVPLGGADIAWFSPRFSEPHSFETDGTHTFAVQAKVPAGVPAGDVRFRLDVFDTGDEETVYTEGQEATVRVAAKSNGVEPKPFPWWMVVAAVVLVGIGITIAKWPSPDPVELPSLVGKDFPEACQIVKDLGLEFVWEPVQVSKSTEDFVVQKQDPQPGLLEDPKKVVTIYYGQLKVHVKPTRNLSELLKEAKIAHPRMQLVKPTVNGFRIQTETGKALPGKIK